MAAKNKDKPEPQLDEDGIVIVEYRHRVLVIIPPDNFGEQGVSQTRAQLMSVHVATDVVSSRYDEVLKGRRQDFFLADGTLDGVDVSKYDGLVISSGEWGELAGDERVLRIVREMHATKKPVGAIGNGLDVLLKAGIVKGLHVTGDGALAGAAKRAGAKYTGRQVESSGNVVTALNESSSVRFGRSLVDALVARLK